MVQEIELVKKTKFCSLVFLLAFSSCANPFVRTIDKIVLLPPVNSVSTVKSNNNTVAEFWGLPGIKFVNWRPNIHIKASSNNGALANRVWEGSAEVDPDTWSLFEYSQVLYYDSNYLGVNIQPNEDAVVDNEIMMPLAFEQKLFKRVSFNSTEEMKYDVAWDATEKSVVISLNTVNSNYLLLTPGTRIAVFATQRPFQWGGVNDYTIVDSIPGGNSLQKSTQKDAIRESLLDRLITRDLGYVTFEGETMEVLSNPEDEYQGLIWFKSMKITKDKIVLSMPNLETGDLAKNYWDKIDKYGIEPFMLFWIAIQQ